MIESETLLRVGRLSPFALVLVAGVVMSPDALAECREPSGHGFRLRGDVAFQIDKGLEWKRCALGMAWDEERGTCSGDPMGLGLEEAKGEAQKLGNGWRLPTAEEFDSIYLESCSGLKIDTIVFPAIAASDFGDGAEFWTDTPISLPGMYYYFNVTHGYVDAHSAGFSLSGLLVRNHE
ncbi:Protein of unknown function [Cohaesibacter marisflavi]|uniref:Lcl C-terminal domain-containing protein n=1 Tax=Cohaesibacter marisflavi TaxID=655353 RepID=A0A1I5NAC7_9HYPH|nr:DUF1566 domain-containing protein [Cohaesibacter marisflavi]SFP18181.1 Protein of unknown function [Cohaesibacter marisflavi]